MRRAKTNQDSLKSELTIYVYWRKPSRITFLRSDVELKAVCVTTLGGGGGARIKVCNSSEVIELDQKCIDFIRNELGLDYVYKTGYV